MSTRITRARIENVMRRRLLESNGIPSTLTVSGNRYAIFMGKAHSASESAIVSAYGARACYDLLHAWIDGYEAASNRAADIADEDGTAAGERIASQVRNGDTCADCGQPGETIGHQTCQMPQDHDDDEEIDL